MRTVERRKVNVLETKCLGSLIGVTRIGRVMNEKVRRRAGIKMELASTVDQRVSRMFEYRIFGKVLVAEVSGGRIHSMRCYHLGSSRGMTVEVVQQWAKDWKEWRALWHILAIVAWLLGSFWPPYLAPVDS